YVAVQFDNSDRKIPVDSDLVTVSREFSKGGEGIYRMNGRRICRKQVEDILRSGDIQVTGFNLIAQHSITRLAEISTEERRRILEDLIGLGVFETKKAEAKVQLSEADLNLRVAAGKIAEASNGVVRARAEAEAAKNILNTRTKQIESLQNQGEQIQNNYKELPTALRNLTAQKASLEARFGEANAKAEKLNTALQNARESLLADAKIHESLDAEIAALEKELSTFIATSKGSSAKLDLTASHLQTLEARHQEFSNLAEELKKRIREMEKLGKEEAKRLQDIEEKAWEYTELKDQRHKEIDEALGVAKRARVTITEFNTQRNIADTLQAEEKALQKLEEMAEEGALKGVLGRLQELI